MMTNSGSAHLPATFRLLILEVLRKCDKLVVIDEFGSF